ncbi:ParB/RepB/Spo0J family partition protein [Rarobacter incanus]|uniref:ParB family chromosome partitioning protein n=1 Tax=Rarobacter incanus TaxID=153494 RepID=A0A542SPZ6_9MICO|nr:ParB/RepB/Spo0J family partition protein [Rarobacter incanus]TQK76690.1 ParB family chromosome partitioning protein [Rarobacter incanus]
MSQKRRGLGKGLGALIPTTSETSRPADLFFEKTGARDEPRPGGAQDATGEAGESARQAPLSPAEAMQQSHRRGTRARAKQPAAAPAAQTAGSAAEKAGPTAQQPAVETNGATATQAEEPDLIPVPGATFAEIPVDRIRPNAKQPRTVFDEDDLAELTQSIAEVGVLQPIVVRPDPSDDGSFELIMGERRWRATQAAGLGTVPAIVRMTEEQDLLRDALLENLHRSALNPLEEAAAYQQLLDDFGCTQEQLSTRIARSRPQISNTLRLLKLPPLVQRRVAAGVLSAGHARALLRLEDPAAMERLAQRIVAEGLSVRATEEIAALGGVPEPSPRREPRPGKRVEAIDELATRLADRLDTRVRIALGKRRGRLTVEFASVDDLNRILGVIAPGEQGLFDTGAK